MPIQGCSNYISNIILDGEYLGVVWFNASAHPIANLTLIDNTTRGEMVGYVPTGPGGGTSIGSGKCAYCILTIQWLGKYASSIKDTLIGTGKGHVNQ